MAAMMVSTNLQTLKRSHFSRLLVYVDVSATDYFGNCVLTKTKRAAAADHFIERRDRHVARKGSVGEQHKRVHGGG